MLWDELFYGSWLILICMLCLVYKKNKGYKSYIEFKIKEVVNCFNIINYLF